MSKKQVNFTCRMARPDADQIDEKVARYGFGTRSKFLTAAGLDYGQTAQLDDVMVQLSEINFTLHRLSQSGREGTAAVPQAEVKALVREARKLMAAAREHLS